MLFLCHKIKNDRTRHVSLGLTQIFENSARSVCVWERHYEFQSPIGFPQPFPASTPAPALRET